MHWSVAPPKEKDGKWEIDHNPVHEAWKSMEECAKQGLTKSIGVSNFNVQSLLDLLSYCNIKPVMNQVEMHVYL